MKEESQVRKKYTGEPKNKALKVQESSISNKEHIEKDPKANSQSNIVLKRKGLSIMFPPNAPHQMTQDGFPNSYILMMPKLTLPRSQ